MHAPDCSGPIRPRPSPPSHATQVHPAAAVSSAVPSVATSPYPMAQADPPPRPAPPPRATPTPPPEPRPGIFRPVILLPSYNNAPKLAAVLDGVAALGLPLLLVNDGSTDDTAHIVDAWARRHHDTQQQEPDLHTLHHARNRGKGAALRTGFAAAAARGYTPRPGDRH